MQTAIKDGIVTDEILRSLIWEQVLPEAVNASVNCWTKFNRISESQLKLYQVKRIVKKEYIVYCCVVRTAKHRASRINLGMDLDPKRPKPWLYVDLYDYASVDEETGELLDVLV